MAPEGPRRTDAPPPLRVDGDGAAWTFDRPFTIGRDAGCDVVVDSARASRRHAEVAPRDGAWHARDLGSANGLLVDGARVDEAAVGDGTTLQIGDGGPHLRLALDAPLGVSAPTEAAASEAAAGEAATGSARPGAPYDPFRPSTETIEAPLPGEEAPARDAAGSVPPQGESAPPPGDAVTYDAVVERYFGDDVDDAEMGDRTRFIRQAYDDIQKAQAEVVEKQHSRYRGLIVAALLVSIAALGYAGYQETRVRQLRTEAEAIFLQLRSYDVAVAAQVTAVQQRIEADPENADSLTVDLDRALEARRRTAARYDRFVRGLGVYDGLSSEEELIYRTARAFGESELTIPPGFVDEVQKQITYWKNGDRFRRGVRHAQVNGHDVDAVNALLRHRMPTEFFYLALQESDFNSRAVGPATRYGYAKGAWQFIPETGRRYGLSTGPLVDQKVYDPLDERHDFPQAADAAGRYLRDIYVHISQASGLLVCASYNWGEGRIKQNMAAMKRNLDGIENDPEHRTYWKFLTTYRHRMPAETKDYVMKIFAAAVIGQNPRLFGIDLDPPVEVARRGGRGGIRTDGAPASGRAARLGTRAVQQQAGEAASD